MSLGRPAKGLPRYYMDVGWYRAPRFVGLPADALFVYEAAVGYCTQHATDGHIPADPEDLAAVLGLRASVVRKAVKALIEREALEPTADSLIVPDWADQNPTAAEVEQHTELQSRKGQLGNHKRWHAGRGLQDPNCPFCSDTEGGPPADQDPPNGDPPDRNGDRSSDPPGDTNGDPQTIAESSLGLGWDRKTDLTSSDTPPEATSPATRHGDSPPPDDDPPSAAAAPGQPEPDTPPDLRQRVGSTLAVLAGRDLDARQTAPRQPPVGDPTSWANGAYDRRRERHADTLADLARQHPDATPEQLADLADPPPDRPRTNGRDPYDDPAWRTAEHQRQHAGMAKMHHLAAEEPDVPLNLDGVAGARARLHQPHRPDDAA